MANGKTNSIFEASVADQEPEVDERFLSEMVGRLKGALTAGPCGWLGPGL